MSDAVIVCTILQGAQCVFVCPIGHESRLGISLNASGKVPSPAKQVLSTGRKVSHILLFLGIVHDLMV